MISLGPPRRTRAGGTGVRTNGRAPMLPAGTPPFRSGNRRSAPVASTSGNPGNGAELSPLISHQQRTGSRTPSGSSFSGSWPGCPWSERNNCSADVITPGMTTAPRNRERSRSVVAAPRTAMSIPDPGRVRMAQTHAMREPLRRDPGQPALLRRPQPRQQERRRHPFAPVTDITDCPPGSFELPVPA